jgi:hypothetical protein
LYVTEVHGEPDGDVRLKMDRDEWKEIGREHYTADEKNDYPYDFVELVRV